MKKTQNSVASFAVDHRTLDSGIYLRSMHKGVMSWDVRFFAPRDGKYMSPGASHTIEHILANDLREDYEIGDKIIAVCPMGCLTGFYIITELGVGYKDIKTALLSAYLGRFPLLSVKDVPGMNEIQCGNPGLNAIDETNKIMYDFMYKLKSEPMK